MVRAWKQCLFGVFPALLVSFLLFLGSHYRNCMPCVPLCPRAVCLWLCLCAFFFVCLCLFVRLFVCLSTAGRGNFTSLKLKDGGRPTWNKVKECPVRRGMLAILEQCRNARLEGTNNSSEDE